MGSLDEQILRATKEIVVKFIETGRISPTGFHDIFQSVYKTVETAARGRADENPDDEDEQAA